ncbi:GIY-YIG nuclease family protein [Nostoc sp. FACHB-190]|uniref:GIY-YIG nuclease family protein n=1 Tax=Nostoc sp. FACHB-190 TaxID=2692838 RepID=UPI0016840689|nr:GIY-YIG nuclease family protein [Nostoc sp. FACHB-190]MBD2301890.1 GIY-YIG nuclease family protein [Nostoc sp. FACHB-190]
MDRLLAIEFKLAGHWLMENGKLKCELIRCYSSQKNVLYAFVCDGQVKYVGKTKDTLASRMSGYKTPGKSQTTNIKNNRHIKELLAKKVAVEIFALPDNGLMHYGQFHLNLAAALEDDIIRIIDPEWNALNLKQAIRHNCSD